jgi:transcriptional regulator with XRE-family HTH domain
VGGERDGQHFLAFLMRFWREREGLSLSQCGRVIGAARSTVSNMEAGRHRPHDDQMAVLDRRYGTGRLFQVLLDEAVLLRPVGPAALMRAQLEHLLEMSYRYYMVLRIVPLEAGPYDGHDGYFQVIGMADREVAYAGAQLGGRLIESPGEVDTLATRFDHIGA